MNPTLMISLLRKGRNGEEILSILDIITDNPSTKVMQTVEALGDTISRGVSINQGSPEPVEI